METFEKAPNFCTPAGGRTLDTLIKSQVLYQLSYKRIILMHFSKCGAKVRTFIETTKSFADYFQFSMIFFRYFYINALVACL